MEAHNCPNQNQHVSACPHCEQRIPVDDMREHLLAVHHRRMCPECGADLDTWQDAGLGDHYHFHGQEVANYNYQWRWRPKIDPPTEDGNEE